MEQYPEAGGLAVATYRSYAIVIEWAETNYSAYVPDVPGCVTTGATVDETIANMHEALEAHLAVTLEYGEPLPEALARVTTIEVAVDGGGRSPSSDSPSASTVAPPAPNVHSPGTIGQCSLAS